MSQGFIFENCKIISATVPINTTGAAADGDWVNMKYYRKCEAIIQQGAWAGGTCAVTVNQATDNAGTNSKAVALPFVYRGTALTIDQPAKVTVTSNTFNLTTVNQYWVVPFSAQDLDMNNGFIWVNVGIASPGSNNDLVSMIYILSDPSYAGLPSTIPTVIA